MGEEMEAASDDDDQHQEEDAEDEVWKEVANTQRSERVGGISSMMRLD